MIRQATLQDLNEIAKVESACFPPNEAASKKEIEDRLTHYANHFWLKFNNDKLIAFIDGFVTDKKDLSDEMYENASLHNEKGSWQMIFGVNTLPEFRKKGHASQLINHVIDCAKKEKRLGVVLTCKKEIIGFYSKFGFIDEGISKSQHGGVVWHQMRLKFKINEN